MTLLRRPELPVALVVAIVIGLLSFAGLLKPFTDSAYDISLRYKTQQVRPASSVLLVEAGLEDGPPDGAELAQVIRTLTELGAVRIVLTSLPEGFSARSLDGVESGATVLLLERLCLQDPEREGSVVPLPLPKLSTSLRFQEAFSVLPPDSDGVCRRQVRLVEVHGKSFPTIEALAGNAPLQGSRTFLVNFRGGPGSLPNVSLRRVLTGGLIPELVRGRTVLVGTGRRPNEMGVRTPTTGRTQPMSLLEFRGHATDTLLSGSEIRETRIWERMLLFLLGACCVLAYLRIPLRWMAVAGGASVALAAGAAFATLWWSNLWLPAGEWILEQVLLVGTVVVCKAGRAEGTFQGMLRTLIPKLRKRFWPVGFYASEKPWGDLLAMLDQTLDLKRTIFLERIPGMKRVREISALRCSIEDIEERRRDYGREPYSKAIAQNSPLRLDRRYLKGGDDSENQYLVSLVFGGEVLGFWAFGVDAEALRRTPGFDALVRRFAEEISELLYHRRRLLEEQSEERSWVNKLVRDESRGLESQSIKTMSLLERRLTQLEGVLEQMTTGIVVFDVFGRPLRTNGRMREFLETENLRPLETKAADLVGALVDKDVSTVRGYLRHVIIHQDMLAIPARLVRERRSLLMTLRPLLLPEEPGDAPEPAAFRTHGILCELSDRTILSQLMAQMGNLTQRLSVRMRGDLASIQMAASVLESKGISETQQAQVLVGVQDAVHRCIENLASCMEFVHLDAPIGELDRYPIDPRISLEAARKKVVDLLTSRELTLESTQSNFCSHVIASPIHLERLFATILTLLIRNTIDGSKIFIRTEEDEKWVSCTFSNSGFGMPSDRFRELVLEDQGETSEEVREFRQSVRWARRWGGDIVVESNVGQGTQITVRLIRFF